MKTTKRQHALEPIKLDAYKPLREVVSETLRQAIKVMNRSRAAHRAFVKLASEHCDVISAANWNWKASMSWFPGAGRMSPIFP